MPLMGPLPQKFNKHFASWLRLEPRARTNDLSGGVAARVADPLWSLARQWVVSELQAENAGSPIRAVLKTEAQEVRLKVGAAEEVVTPAGVPLEALVERERPGLDWRMRVRIGQRFERHARARGEAGARLVAAYLSTCGVARPSGAEWEALDSATRDFIDAFAGRALDGKKLLDERARGTLPALPAGIDAAALNQLFVDLNTWRQSLFSEPHPADNRWQASKLAYRFELNPPDPAAPDDAPTRAHLVADQYRNGELDWHSMSVSGGLGNTWKALPEVDAVPTRISVGGTAVRWWAFEDATTDFGALDVATPDLSKLLLMEFVLLYGDDWFSLPAPAAVGELIRTKKLTIHTVFDETIEVDSARAVPEDPLARWELFSLSNAADPTAPGVGDCLFIAPRVAQSEQSPPVEEVRFLKDEGANLVFGVEYLLPNGLGAPVGGHSAQLERMRRAGGQQVANPAPGDGLSYRLSTTIPENWIPFVPAAKDHQLGDERYSYVLQRAQMLRNAAPGSQAEPISALSRLLGSWADPLLWLEEHAVPRAGLRVLLTKQRARDATGRTHVWVGKRVLMGRGEGSSGLKFDVVS